MVATRALYLVVTVAATLLLYVYIYIPNLWTQKPKPTTNIYNNTQAIKYILLWNNSSMAPLNFLGHGFDAFTAQACEYTNCFVTDNWSALRSVADYDAVVFNGRHLPQHLPQVRSEKQKYVYANMESCHNYPVCSDRFEGFFNWTWTYKLDSDSKWGYFTIYNLTGHVVGPRVDMHWPDMDPVDIENKEVLTSKNVAAAWFVSNCKSKSRRESFAEAVTKELFRLDLSLDVYGTCGEYVCTRKHEAKCNQMLEKDYYFYFAFENSFSEDYVTEKVLTALLHRTVPVVFGEANYSRFLPPGSYLDARKLGPRRLAQRMAAIIENHQSGGSLYHDFFRWRNHFVYKQTFESEDVCNICKLMNDPVAMATTTTYGRFRRWWNSQYSSCPVP